MSVQARMTENDRRLYNPNRDVAHNFKQVVELVAGRLEDGRWAPVTDYMTATGMTDEQLGLACEAFVKFVASATEHKDEAMGACMDRTGWFAVPEPAQVAYMAYLGTIMAGIFWRGAREATLGGEGPLADVKDLVAAGDRCLRHMSVPRWQRKPRRTWERLKGAFRALRGKH
jgi:hypothetical protein